jgi:hypothetical protein
MGSARRLRAAGDAYERADGLVTKIARHSLTSLALRADIFPTDGAPTMLLGALPNDLANPPDAPAGGDVSD